MSMSDLDFGLMETATFNSVSSPISDPSSPRNRVVKFLCSHGGKIIPRPADGQLKYVGGETRVISVPRDVPFQELMKKLTCIISDGEMILKYQAMSEDLDTLISVKSDEDIQHMFDEMDRYESKGAARFRTFLFPAAPVLLENPYVDPQVLEQRYIDAINGVVRSAFVPIKQHPIINSMQIGSLVSSTGSSPRSPPDGYLSEVMNNESSYLNNRYSMYKVQSSPALCTLQNNQYNVNQLPPQYFHRPSPKLVADYHYRSVALDRQTSARSRTDGGRYQLDANPSFYNSASRQSRGSGYSLHYDESSQFMDRRMLNRMGSPAKSPVPPTSPRGQSQCGHGMGQAGTCEHTL